MSWPGSRAAAPRSARRPVPPPGRTTAARRRWRSGDGRWSFLVPFRVSFLPGWSFLGLDGESQLYEHRVGAVFPALEIAGGEALAGGELVRGAQDCFRRVTVFVPDQVVGGGRAETVRGEELLRPQPVVLRYRAHHVITGHAVPRHMCHRVLPGSLCRCSHPAGDRRGRPGWLVAAGHGLREKEDRPVQLQVGVICRAVVRIGAPTESLSNGQN